MKKTTTLRRWMLVTLAIVMVASFTLMSACESKDSGGDTSGATTAQEGDDASNLTQGGEFKGKNLFDDKITISWIPMSTAGVSNRMLELVVAQVFKFHSNIEVKIFDPAYDPTNQEKYIQESITSQYDGILLEAMDPEMLGAAVDQAEAAGIPVLTLNTTVNATHTCYLYGNDYDSGYEAAGVLGDAIKKGTVIAIDGPAEQQATNRMTFGFEDGIKDNFPDIEFLERSPTANWATENANTNTRDLLTKYDNKIDGIYCASDDLAVGVLQAVQAAGLGDKIKIYGSMGFPSSLSSIKAGDMFATYFSDYYLEDSTAFYYMMYFIENGINVTSMGYSSTPKVDQPTTPVTAANIDQIIGASHWLDTGEMKLKLTVS